MILGGTAPASGAHRYAFLPWMEGSRDDPPTRAPLLGHAPRWPVSTAAPPGRVVAAPATRRLRSRCVDHPRIRGPGLGATPLYPHCPGPRAGTRAPDHDPVPAARVERSWGVWAAAPPRGVAAPGYHSVPAHL